MFSNVFTDQHNCILEMRTNFDFDGCNTPHKIWDRDQTNVKRLSKLDCPDMSLMKNVLTHHEKESQAMMTTDC